jgi:hypothetical protein
MDKGITIHMSDGAQWLIDLDPSSPISTADGLVLVKGYQRDGRMPEEIAMMEKAEAYEAYAVFFEVERNNKPPVAQAFVFISEDPGDDQKFAELHQRLWSWGGVPLLYRKTKGLIQLFRCAHKPDFVSATGETICKPHKILRIATAINSDPIWDSSRLRNGTMWDDYGICKDILSANKGAHKRLVDAVKHLNIRLSEVSTLNEHLRRKLLILSLLIAYLEERKVLLPHDFEKYLTGATKFFQVLANGNALVEMLWALEERFNGNVFTLAESDKTVLRNSGELAYFAQLVEGHQEVGGQRTIWQLYSFKDLPVELISHIYQLFVKDANTAVYTPPFVVRLMLEEALSWPRIDRLHERDEIILDPSCGSGVFLVEAYKRLVVHWRSRNQWRRPNVVVLKELLMKVHGIDLDDGAVELAAFSLCLALCDALKPETIRASIRLFDPLIGKTLHHSCFFEAKENGLIKKSIGVVAGNPPFKSNLGTEGAERSATLYELEHGRLPDNQLAYLFLHEAMNMIEEGGVLVLLQQYNFLYNQQTLDFRKNFISTWDLREVLDFVSIRGLFQKGSADTKAIVVVVEHAKPPEDRKILHATFRRSGKSDSEQGFDIDYYDLHSMPRHLVIANDGVWRTNLFGGGRVLGLVDRLKNFRTLKSYSDNEKWDAGEGFIEGARGVSRPAEHIIGKNLLPSTALTSDGIDMSAITVAPNKNYEGPRSESRFLPPALLIREHMDIPHALWTGPYLTYTQRIVGFPAPIADVQKLVKISDWLLENKTAIQGYLALISPSLFTQKATALQADDIYSIPYPESLDLDLSSNEQILIEDIVTYQRDLIRLGESSTVMKSSGIDACAAFTHIFTQQINAIYRENPIRALNPQTWSGIICQPFVFGTGDVDWEDASSLKDKVDALLEDNHSTNLHITRITQIYDGNFIFLIKPNRLRYWLRSIALRDADETLFLLRSKGF